MMILKEKSTLHWLEKILAERFGHIFAIEDSVDHGLTLSLPGEVKYIRINTHPDGFVAHSHPALLLAHWRGDKEGWLAPLGWPIAAPGTSSLAEPVIEQTTYGYCIRYDILSLICWMLSRAEEVGRSDLDEHGRFPATSSHAFQNGYLTRPVVDEWLHILGQVMQRLWPGISLKQHTFNLKVSHDVDIPSRYGFSSPLQLIRSIGGDLLKRGDLRNCLFAPWIRLHTKGKLHPRDPANTFDWIMDISEARGLRSAFYFVCGRTDSSKDAFYEVEHSVIRDLIRRIHARGHEIGLHPSYNTYRDPAAIVVEANRLRQVCADEGIKQSEWGGRMHYLRWQQPITMFGWESAGMDYDCSLGYADSVGFRCGTCFEYPAFDPVATKMLNLRIRPLVAMDVTVLGPNYMNMGAGEQAYQKLCQLKNACRAVNGCFTILWHNTGFGSTARRKLYEKILDS